jgi:hypothetical protein
LALVRSLDKRLTFVENQKLTDAGREEIMTTCKYAWTIALVWLMAALLVAAMDASHVKMKSKTRLGSDLGIERVSCHLPAF